MKEHIKIGQARLEDFCGAASRPSTVTATWFSSIWRRGKQRRNSRRTDPKTARRIEAAATEQSRHVESRITLIFGPSVNESVNKTVFAFRSISKNHMP